MKYVICSRFLASIYSLSFELTVSYRYKLVVDDGIYWNALPASPMSLDLLYKLLISSDVSRVLHVLINFKWLFKLVRKF